MAKRIAKTAACATQGKPATQVADADAAAAKNEPMEKKKVMKRPNTGAAIFFEKLAIAQAPPASLAPEFVFVMGHSLWRSGLYIFCRVCRAYSSNRPKLLSKQCPRAYYKYCGHRSARINNSIAGRHPKDSVGQQHQANNTAHRISLVEWLELQRMQAQGSIPRQGTDWRLEMLQGRLATSPDPDAEPLL